MLTNLTYIQCSVACTLNLCIWTDTALLVKILLGQQVCFPLKQMLSIHEALGSACRRRHSKSLPVFVFISCI